MAIVRCPTKAEFKRYQDRVKHRKNGEIGDLPQGAEELADCCVIYPDKEVWGRICEKAPRGQGGLRNCGGEPRERRNGQRGKRVSELADKASRYPRVFAECICELTGRDSVEAMAAAHVIAETIIWYRGTFKKA